MKKWLIILFPISYAFASVENWQDFNNNFYLGGGYSINTSTVNSLGSNTTNSSSLALGTTALFDNNIYANLEANANFLAGSANFIDNWYAINAKIGYALNNQYVNFIPYLLLSSGNNGAYYSNSLNYGYGGGILTEAAINNQFGIFVDISYQLQNFTGAISDDFNHHVLNNYASYSITGTPSNYGITIGGKYITAEGYYISPFFNYQQYQQDFVNLNSGINYGNLSSTVSQYRFGINVGWVL
jgi:hypothetical protein